MEQVVFAIQAILKRTTKNYFRVLAFLWMFFSLNNPASAQNAILIEVSGKVTDQVKKEPLRDVSVQVKGTVTGTITNKEGDFKLRTKSKLPLTLIFSSIGFKAQEFEVQSLGAVVGSHTVTLADKLSEDPKDSDAGGFGTTPKSRIPVKYSSESKKFEVKSGAVNKANFELSSK